MADLVFGNLADLKAAVLPNALQGDTLFDARITSLGKGVARLFETYCDRKFSRTVGILEEFPADCMHYVLQYAPVETITLFEQRDTIAGGWYTLDIGNILNRADNHGLVDFGYIVGQYSSRLRITYTGGYFHEVLEPTDGGYPTTPVGTPVPDDLKEAWYQQCEASFGKIDKLGRGALSDQVDTQQMPELEPGVVQRISQYRRYCAS